MKIDNKPRWQQDQTTPEERLRSWGYPTIDQTIMAYRSLNKPKTLTQKVKKFFQDLWVY